METTIRSISPVEYELEINASSEDLAAEIDKELRAQRSRTEMKGFRPGKVPIKLVKRIYGKAVAYGVAEKSIQDVYEREIMEGGEHDVLGSPKITALDYEMDGALHATVRFGVRPEFELADVTGIEIPRLTHDVTDVEVDKEIEHLRQHEAELAPSSGPADEKSHVIVDLQRLDEATQTPIVGEKEEGVEFALDDDHVLKEMKNALVGKSVGDLVRIQLPHQGDSQEQDAEHLHTYEIAVKDVKTKELPDLDDEFASSASKGKLDNLEDLRKEVRRQLETTWKGRSRRMFEGAVVDRMLELHPLEIPESVVEIFLESFLEDFKKQMGGPLPEQFDAAGFRERQKPDAERQARWMLIRDKLIESEGMEVTDEDRDAFFQESADGEGFSPELLRQYYNSVPGLSDKMNERLLSERVFDWLGARFTVVDKDRDAFEKEMAQ